MANFRELSRQGWDGSPTHENINIGSLQRIADAVEKMSGSYSEIIRQRDNYKNLYEQKTRLHQASERQCASLRGVITKLKKKAATT